ncbi:MAG TPA: BNR-repeat neuraminidase N-terminal domain-containing protein, partial [Ferruginibacter sp.]|nr:BNR-repeat neuraminidase N-terminal domain-containing protein [Ferruginibacter sp.]
ITDNIVGSYAMYGIQVSTANAAMSGNLIRNMTGNSNGAALIVSSGIILSGSTGVYTIVSNTIHSLFNAAGAANGSIYALYCSFPSTANVVSKNIIHSLNITSTNSAAQIVGLLGVAGSGTYQNNMVRLGVDANGASINSGIAIYGIFDIAGTNNYYHNSVYIGGSAVTSSSTTFAFVSNVTTGTRNFKNNIFFNNRINATGTAANVAYAVSGTAPAMSGLSGNGNVYYAPNPNGVAISSGASYTVAGWQAATAGGGNQQDLNSFDAYDPQFVLPDGTASTVDLHLKTSPATICEANGIVGTGVTDDYDGQTRASFTPIDIGADAGNFTSLPPMSYVSSAAVQQTGSACASATNVRVLRMDIVTAGVLNPLTLTNLTINGNGTSNLGDISSYRIYYTGTSSTFSTSNPIIAAATGLTASNVVITPSSTVTLTSGTNYFWLTYNIVASPVGPVVDGEFTNVTLSTGGGIPVPTAPAGNLSVFATPTAGASSNSPVCTGGTLQLTGTSDIGTSFSWTGPSFTSTSQSPGIGSITSAAAGTYTFIASANG